MQRKALVYANAIEAKLAGLETKEIVVDHELANAISRGASIARAKGIKVDGAEASSQREGEAQPAEKPKAKRGRRAKVVEA
ncbi:hypothetical protein B5M44_17990 [Shinella sumterensis]|nr:hypothetical protein B5M44_17990 [Shinella sumterensis]